MVRAEDVCGTSSELYPVCSADTSSAEIQFRSKGIGKVEL